MLTYQLLFAAVLIVNFIIVGRYRRKAQAGQKFSLKEEGTPMVIVLRGIALLGVAYMLTFVFAPGLVEFSLLPFPAWLRWSAALVGVSVLPFSVHHAQKALGNNVTTTVITRDNHELITHGPYRWVRHPLYLNGCLLYLVLALISGSWLILAMLSIAFIAIVIRTRKEEAMLFERFGQPYRNYQQRTGRFIPRLRPFAPKGK